MLDAPQNEKIMNDFMAASASAVTYERESGVPPYEWIMEKIAPENDGTFRRSIVPAGRIQDDYAPDERQGDNNIAHAVMHIHGQKIFLNDRFGNKEKSLNCAVHLIAMFSDVDELLACYEYFKEGSTVIDPFTELPYSKLSGNFMDEFGVQWGFMTEQ